MGRFLELVFTHVDSRTPCGLDVLRRDPGFGMNSQHVGAFPSSGPRIRRFLGDTPRCVQVIPHMVDHWHLLDSNPQTGWSRASNMAIDLSGIPAFTGLQLF